MKHARTLILAAALVAAAYPPCAAQTAAPDIIPVAVLDLDGADGRLKERGAQLGSLVTAHLSTADGVATVERQELAKLLGEQELGGSGMVDPGTAARIGHLTGARVLVTGRLFTVSGETTAALKVMSTETGRVFGVVETFGADAPPSGPAAKIAEKIGVILTGKRAELIAQPARSEDRVARIKQKLGTRKPPTVSISIPEEHLSARVPDPAAETEIGLILGQAGFVLVADPAAADYRITGEAFSETAMRRGNLVSCRARVEVKVLAKEGGRVALMDRQTTWAVDPAEHIAGKLALQRAGGELAERIAESLLATK